MRWFNWYHTALRIHKFSSTRLHGCFPMSGHCGYNPPMFIIPLGHAKLVVEELPFATIGIIAVCLLLLVAYGLVDRPEIARIWRHEPYERATLAVTFFSTVALSLEWAILLGLLTAMVSGRVKAWRGH